MTRRDAHARGRDLAALCAGAWRARPAAGPVPSLDAILPQVLAAGMGGLAWRRVRATAARHAPGLGVLREAFALHALQAEARAQALRALVAELRAEGWDPIVGKGWAIARLYPEMGLRPYGDVDFFIEPATAVDVAACLARSSSWMPVDLHHGAADLDDTAFDELRQHSRLVDLEGVEVRVFGAEDHLRLLSLHLMRHGAWRPLWLVDVALAYESRPPDFDWSRLLAGRRQRRDAVVCALAAAGELLGIDLQGTPVEPLARSRPDWFVPAMLEQWGRGQMAHGRRRPMATYLRSPRGFMQAFRLRWPNAIEATMGVSGAFNSWPRLPYQVAECVRRAGAALRPSGP